MTFFSGPRLRGELPLPLFSGRRWARRNAWRLELLDRLVTDVLPREPYQFESALSFLQEHAKLAAWYPFGPIRLDLFYHTLPLAIDVVGPEGSPQYPTAAPYLTKSDWSERQRCLALKRDRLERYQCPYLILTPDEPLDPASLKAKISNWLGRNL